MSSWSIADVFSFLTNLGCSAAAGRVWQEGVDGRVLLDLVRSDLLELGIPENQLDEVVGKIRAAKVPHRLSWAECEPAMSGEPPAFGGAGAEEVMEGAGGGHDAAGDAAGAAAQSTSAATPADQQPAFGGFGRDVGTDVDATMDAQGAAEDSEDSAEIAEEGA